MSHQKHHVSARKSISPSASLYSKSTKYSRHGDYRSNRYTVEMGRGSHRQRCSQFEDQALPPSLEDFTTRNNHHTNKSHMSNSSCSTNSDLLRLSQQEVLMLRNQLSDLKDAFAIYQDEKESPRPFPKLCSCFGFFRKKKCKPEIERYNSKLSISEAIYNERSISDKDSYYRHSKSSHKSKKKDKERENRAKQHRITNNNTIVLPESYAQNSNETMNNISARLDEHGNEIKEIKDRLNLCVELLRENVDPVYCNNSKFIFDEYIKLNTAISNSRYCNVFNKSIDNGNIFKKSMDNSMMKMVSKLHSNHAIIENTAPIIDEVSLYTDDKSAAILSGVNVNDSTHSSNVFLDAINECRNVSTTPSSVKCESRKGDELNCQYNPKRGKRKAYSNSRSKSRSKSGSKVRARPRTKHKKECSFIPGARPSDAKGNCFMACIRYVFRRRI